jgi:hypothetical protein
LAKLDPSRPGRYAALPDVRPVAMADHGISDDQYEVLGEAGECSVYRCEHGCLHVQIGDLNLRIEDDRFAELAEAVAAATQAAPDLLRWVGTTGNGPAH